MGAVATPNASHVKTSKPGDSSNKSNASSNWKEELLNHSHLTTVTAGLNLRTDQHLTSNNTATRSMTSNTKALRLSRDEAATLLDAMDSVSEPFWNWSEHDAISQRLRDLIIWLDAE